MYPQQNYNYMPQQAQQMNYMRQITPYTSPSPIQSAFMQGIKGRPVASFDEAKAQTIDFDGSIFFFPNLGNNVIYTKQINPDGTATLNVYQLVEMPVSTSQVSMPVDNFVTKEEFNAAIQDILTRITVPTVKAPEEVKAINSAVAKF